MTLSLPIDPEANEFINRNQLALILGLVLDQQVSMEKAFSSPYVLTQRLGHDLDARELAGYDPDAYRSVADVTDAESLRLVREYKQQMKAAAKAKSAGD
ncbi:hypothetical protein AB0M35_04945 [Micromonospora sp. NPDC051196]|uniref:hypothetical protein n=1 Tax=Micromonospora sp. NPDC051196 TaxID=3155281 RepID=UPI0034128C45